MSWLKLTKDSLFLMESSNFTDKVDVEKVDGTTLGLNIPLQWFRADDAPRQLIISLQSATSPPSGSSSVPGWKSFYAGIDMSNGSQIPRKGLDNPTLGDKEPFGDVVQFAGMNFVKGQVSWFGGKNDDGVTETETGSLTGEVLRKLQDVDYYCAMRWSFSPNGKSFWENRRLLVVNPVNQKAVIVRAIDWGPNTSTKRIIDLSFKALQDLDADTDDDLLVSFATPNSQPVGLV